MKIGGLKTRFLFPDMLETGKEYPGHFTGYKMQDVKNKPGKQFPVLVWLGAIEHGVPGEYEVGAFNIETADARDIEDFKGHSILKKKGDRIFVTLTEATK